MNGLRKDYLLDRWVVIAPRRRRRPSDFRREKDRETGRRLACPFCPGNEHLTPPASLIYLLKNGKLEKTKDSDKVRRKGWIIRCIPNLYPAFSLPKAESESQRSECEHTCMKAFGHHEVLIESPDHDEHPSVARVSQLIYVINALKDRVAFFLTREYVKYVSIFRNYGASAGASLSHTHTQLIAIPMIPKILEEERAASKRYYEENGRCIFCDILNRELKSERFIWDNGKFIVFAPWASLNPFEFWIFPKRHHQSILELTKDEVKSLAEALRVSLGGLKSLLNDPPYNLGFHMMPDKHYHWHIEVYPKLAVWAGFEKSTGMYINTVPPEEAAENLRKAFENEEKTL